MEDEEQEETKVIELVCHTEGCGNEGIPIRLEVPVTFKRAYCGVCNTVVTDIRDVGEDEPPLPTPEDPPIEPERAIDGDVAV